MRSPRSGTLDRQYPQPLSPTENRGHPLAAQTPEGCATGTSRSSSCCCPEPAPAGEVIGVSGMRGLSSWACPVCVAGCVDTFGFFASDADSMVGVPSGTGI